MTDDLIGDPTEARPAASTDCRPELREIAARLDELTREMRRQGRAAIAAQAAAESCLEVMVRREATAATESEEPAQGEREAAALHAETTVATAWLRALVPIADALERIVAEVERAQVAGNARPRSIWARLRGERSAADPGVRSLGEGARLLLVKLEAALVGLGVAIDRRVGVAIDPEIHRVVEVEPRGARKSNRVARVVRAGYAVGGRLVREADVVATASNNSSNPREK